ncbi:hypothetical protein [Paucisalibacillus globulus]|uniref:hypothetical protein n=1 Tax=Paucisalibacillus globulus TaxID=351095 RepID=UPI0004290E5A|nr:hypothetical protein [Paucisalibacillus globulus]
MLVGCSQNPELDSVGTPPPVSLEVGDEQYSMTMGGFSWTKKGRISSITSTTDAPSPNQMAFNMEPVLVDGESEVTINTTGDPYLSVYLWNEDAMDKEIPLQENQFTLPNEAGRYIYEVFAEWAEGEGSYTIVFEVE